MSEKQRSIIHEEAWLEFLEEAAKNNVIIEVTGGFLASFKSAIDMAINVTIELN